MKTTVISALAIVGAAVPASLSAQELSADLATNDTDELRGAVQTRYDAALAATNNVDVVAANDPRYLWANEAKAQCAIALGFLKSDTRDEASIAKCDYAYGLMTQIPRRPVAPPPPPPPPLPAPEVCTDQQPGIVFFGFDSAEPMEGATQTIQFLAGNAETCGWDSFRVVGHADRAGSNTYNEALSLRRAEAIADLMVGLGIDRSRMSISAEGETNPRVPTADGIRSPENRRVEITVSR
ncbi:OmpA family protein [Erythrobacter rubeus]|uniref:OmpA family protein n=1 Tax=Erythrobacter rubeus TaxID=2760803 RepID=A0ABR8KPK1_9SPHN|nr:OmpA family protein [Erythrobacter rubeus]MBD2841205.1 OmpA family protein [Erythrobacter rubeus]